MSQPFRIAGGTAIDRSRPATARFDGHAVAGFVGDTLASALLAQGRHLVGRSFKYHRPRGIFSAGVEEPNALVTLVGHGRRTPNLRATEIDLFDGLDAISQNNWPNLEWDLGGLLDRAAPLFPAGFYYKMFMGLGPLDVTTAWTRVYEPVIRQLAGLGRAPTLPDPDRYAQRYAHCDVLVVGGGAAGLSAALAAAKSGARVILCEQEAGWGGWLRSERARIDGVPAHAWAAARAADLADLPQVQMLVRTQAFGYFPDNFVGLVERLNDSGGPGPRERMWQVRAREVVLATGAIERPLVFPDNDRPGILLASAGETYLTRFGVAPGTRVAIATGCDSAYGAALALAEAGIAVAGLYDIRSSAPPDLAKMLQARGVTVEAGARLSGTKGRLRIAALEVGGRPIACDALLVSGGWTPSVHLHSQARGKLKFDAAINAYVPGDALQRVRSAGSAAGRFGLSVALADGAAAGAAAAEACGLTPAPLPAAEVVEIAWSPGAAIGAVKSELNPRKTRAFVDFQNDVTAKDLLLATQEGMVSIEHVKRYTTNGMATDQGKTSNLNALAIVAEALAKPVPEVGLTTYRMPYTPISFGAMAGYGRGHLFDPERRTPIDAWAEAQGGVFEPVGLWRRARYFPKAGETMAAAVGREALTVRQSLGMVDASTLGKIEVVGPDAAEFLERLYINAWKKLAPGRCRYGVLLNEAGFIIDDGVIARLAEDRFHVTTTTGGAARVLNMMEDYRQTEWPELKVWLTSTTEHWSVIAIQGPRARAAIAPLVEEIDLAPSALPHMAMAEGRIAGVATRLFRVSFTGELGFEINVPASQGRAVWDAVWSRCAAEGGCAYGTEALHVLRAEKGYIIIGQDTDGTVTPEDAGLSWAIGKAKRDFVGKRALRRPDMVKADRPQFVGLKPVDPSQHLEEGAQVIAGPRVERGTVAIGHVTSAYASPILNRPIALGLVAAGRSRLGGIVHVVLGERTVPVELVSPVFYDPEGRRLDG